MGLKVAVIAAGGVTATVAAKAATTIIPDCLQRWVERPGEARPGRELKSSGRKRDGGSRAEPIAERAASGSACYASCYLSPRTIGAPQSERNPELEDLPTVCRRREALGLRPPR